MLAVDSLLNHKQKQKPLSWERESGKTQYCVNRGIKALPESLYPVAGLKPGSFQI